MTGRQKAALLLVPTPEMGIGKQRDILTEAANAQGLFITMTFSYSWERCGVSNLISQILHDAGKRFSVLVVYHWRCLWVFGARGVVRLAFQLSRRDVDILCLDSNRQRFIPALPARTRELLQRLEEVETLRLRLATKAFLRLPDERGGKVGRPPVKVDVTAVRLLRNQGLSLRQIALRLGVSKSKVWSVLHGK